MREIQRFALENIYCAPHQDQQYTFKLVRVTKPERPVKRKTQVYAGVLKHLPNDTDRFHTYVIGNLNPNFINLLKQHRDWYRDSWVKVSDDMVERNYILQFYNKAGVMCPRSNIYYMFMDESSILFAVRLTEDLTRNFDFESFEYLRVYSNRYFTSSEYLSSSSRKGIELNRYLVNDNSQKVTVQTKITQQKLYGGDVMVYVNGHYTKDVTLHLPTPAVVEVLYDQSIISKETFAINTLRTFQSTKDSKLKYLLHRDPVIDRIQYEDDNELYITTNGTGHSTGLYFYQHKDFVVRNVTDKDYSLYTQYVNNQATILSDKVGGVLSDKAITIYTRKSGLNRDLKYTSLKLHELYKLPKQVQLDVLSNTNYTITDFRAETLEASDYFKLASLKSMSYVTGELSRSAIGYNGISYYYANPTMKINAGTAYVNVPKVYRTDSTVYEYDSTRLLVGRYPTQGPTYIPSSTSVRHLEFIRGTESNSYGALYEKGEVIHLRDFEYKLLMANFQGLMKQSPWVDVTDNESKVTVTGQVATLNLEETERIKIVYQDNPIIVDLKLPLSQGTMIFPVKYLEDRGGGITQQLLDYTPETLEVFLNGHRLTYKLDYFVELPYVNIVNKTYLDYTKQEQDVHIRIRGVSETLNDLNCCEVNGFVNNGVLGRNNRYDIRDDRTFTVFVGGKIYSKENLRYAEEDNTVRLSDPLNGLPYTIAESMIPLYDMTGIDTTEFYKLNSDLNTRIAGLYDLIYPEPNIDEFNIIADHHYLYSPVVSKVIHALLLGIIPPAMYTNPYEDTVIFDLLETNEYKTLHKLDPIRADLPDNLVEIHPHLGNTHVNLNLHQYRFVTNLVRILTNNKPDKINLSGYITVTA